MVMGKVRRASAAQWSRVVMGAGIVAMSMGLGGCATLEELRQEQMARRNLEAQLAESQQSTFDQQALAEQMRNRAAALDDQVNTHRMLTDNLKRENDALASNFQRAQDLNKELAKLPVGQVLMTQTKLPAELDSALKQFAGQYPNAVAYDSQSGTVKWTSDLLFDLGSDKVKDGARESLRQFSDIMKSSAGSGFDMMVVGHTDDVRIAKPDTKQAHPTNRHLSTHRAIAVFNVLASNGLPSGRIFTGGFGEDRPVMQNASDDGRARNRRVEIYIVPRGAFSSDVASAASLTGSPAPAGTPTK